jgi:hypothetical protein
MNYAAAYTRLMERAAARTLDGYVEKHHVVPRCMGGKDSLVVRLTPEEHYVAHQLLVRMYPGDHRLLWAAVSMTNATRQMPGRNNKLYGWLRREFSAMMSTRMTGRRPSPETREKLRLAKLGKKREAHTDETKAKMRAAALGRKKSPEHCAAIAKAKTGAKYAPRSAESRERTSIAVKAAFANGAKKADQTRPEHRLLQANIMNQIWERRHRGELPLPNHRKLTTGG